MGDTRATEMWRAVLGELQLKVNRSTYDTWLKSTRGLSITDGVMTVGVANSFAVEWLERRMYQLIRATVQKMSEGPVEVRFRVGNGPPEVTPTGDSFRPPLSSPQTAAGILNEKYTFDNFVVGPSNRLPYSAARAVAEAPGRVYHPLFLYSGVGLGKTHLLHAIGHACISRGMSLIYATCEQFTNEFITAIRNRTTEEFRHKYRSVEVLLIDDIQFIIGKEQTQEVFFHTFNDLHNSNRQVVITSDRPPKALTLLEDRLRSRFGWGLIADIQPPDLETRMAILRTKAEQLEGVKIDDTVIEYVAKKVQKNVRDLEGSLTRTVAFARSKGCPITVEVASLAIADFMQDPAHQHVDPDKILAEVTSRFKVSRDSLIGPSRKKAIVTPRHVAMYLLHEELAMRDTDIGRLLGGRDHSTVISAVAKVNYEISVNAQLRQDVLAIKESVFK